MTCPWILHVAFILGLNPYSKLFSLYIFYIFVAFNILYVIVSSFYMMYNLIILRLGFILTFSVAYRMFLFCFFVINGALDYDSTFRFYDRIFSEITFSMARKDSNLLSLATICVSCVLLLESLHVFQNNMLENCAMFIGASLNILVPQITMAQFSLSCVVIDSLYSCLLRDVRETYSHTASYTIRRLRARQVDVSDVVKNVNQVFGLKVLLYFVAIQIMLIQKADFIVSRLAIMNYDIVLVTTSITVFTHLLAVWLYCYSFCRAQKKHEDVLAAVLDLPTKEMNIAAIEEVVLFAEELYHRPTLFSAAGCFYVGFHAFYSVIGVLLSYLMIVGPLAFHNK